MSEALKKLLENDVLTDDVKEELKTAFETQVAEATTEKEASLKEAYDQKVAELAKDTMGMIEEAVADSMKDVEDELAEARSLDIKYAQRLEDFKEQYATAKDAEIAEMVKTLVSEEIEEMKESIEEARKHVAGKRMYEAFAASYGELVEGEQGDAAAELKEANEELATLRREKKLNELMEGITGKNRKVIMTLMEGVSDEKLEDRFEEVSKSILIDEQDDKSTKDDEKLDEQVSEEEEEGTRVVESEEASDKKVRRFTSKHYQRLAGFDV